MSELIQTPSLNRAFHRRLLESVSALALIVPVYLGGNVRADVSSDRPTVWIELGGQLTQLDASEDKFAPPFIFHAPRPAPETISPLGVGHLPRRSFDGEGKIAFEPKYSEWLFSVSVRYGRSSARQHLRQQSPYPTQPVAPLISSGQEPVFRQALQSSDVTQKSRESHAIFDFQAGKDVGLGMFGSGSTSVLGFGLRFAQFSSRTNSTFSSDPDAHPTFVYLGPYSSIKLPKGGVFHSYGATANVSRSFHGLGPSISWNASSPLVRDHEGGGLALNWGLNAAVLFGRQKVRIHHQTTARYHAGKYSAYNPPYTRYHNAPSDEVRARSVIVPNIGGFAGISFDYASGKVSFGYRADFFFNAMDSGIDRHKDEIVGFYGPFAAISIGLP